MSLAELQDRIQSAILTSQAPGQDDLSAIKDSLRGGKSDLFLIYHEGYRLRLAEFISNDYPTLRLYLGDELFGALVEDYIVSGPSRLRNARFYASRLPDFMANADRWRGDRFACDLARLEHALLDAFDAADAEAIGVEALNEIAETQWPRLVFRFHPSLRMLELDAGVASRYDVLASGVGELSDMHTGVETDIVWRYGGDALHRTLDAAEAVALTHLLEGASFSVACARMAASDGGPSQEIVVQIASFMAQWFADGLVIGVAAPDLGA
jgi:Putative DNA-binding domain